MSALQRLQHNCNIEVSPGYTARPCFKGKRIFGSEHGIHPEMKPSWDAILGAAMHLDMCQPVAWLLPVAGWLEAVIFLLFCSAVWVGIHKCSKNRPSVRAVEVRERGALLFKSGLLLEQYHRWESGWLGRNVGERLF